jgi:hypothetical protein
MSTRLGVMVIVIAASILTLEGGVRILLPLAKCTLKFTG